MVLLLLFFLADVSAWPYIPGPSEIISRTARVLNFFPIPVSEECSAQDGRRSGTCLNAYECRLQNGDSQGPCALGFGVCCVFTASCDSMIDNNITYFVSPEFPSLTRSNRVCSLQVKKMAPDVTQIRLDFIHFNLGQPNRRTGVCETDIFTVSGGSSRDIRLCGQNSGQHLYFDVENIKDPITITMNLTQPEVNRIWEIKITQIEFNRRAPAGCSQYLLGVRGVVQTMNYAINGRHLANQDYTVCIRQEEKMCSIVYEPCDENSFKIGPPIGGGDDMGSGDGAMMSMGNGNNRQCNDRIVMACDTEDFISASGSGGLCDLLHCGSTFCSDQQGQCRIESSVKPFNIRIQFGEGLEESPDDNLGMCLKYDQQPCT
ncbi:uncharacterized protein [Halyomorpha halys]|uniref:uncharacterized protein n=1 Tax=Halyomorpha halys TaxID=286706 RepID=UPI0006D51EDC|nr:uncharacterized protein LOC106684818 [Halyomorpha halys]